MNPILSGGNMADYPTKRTTEDHAVCEYCLEDPEHCACPGNCECDACEKYAEQLTTT